MVGPGWNPIRVIPFSRSRERNTQKFSRQGDLVENFSAVKGVGGFKWYILILMALLGCTSAEGQTPAYLSSAYGLYGAIRIKHYAEMKRISLRSMKDFNDLRPPSETSPDPFSRGWRQRGYS